MTGGRHRWIRAKCVISEAIAPPLTNASLGRRSVDVLAIAPGSTRPERPTVNRSCEPLLTSDLPRALVCSTHGFRVE